MTDPDIAQRIASYWQSRGYAVQVDVRLVPDTYPAAGRTGYHAVRSDMRNGLPRSYAAGELALWRQE